MAAQASASCCTTARWNRSYPISSRLFIGFLLVKCSALTIASTLYGGREVRNSESEFDPTHPVRHHVAYGAQMPRRALHHYAPLNDSANCNIPINVIMWRKYCTSRIVLAD